MGIAPTFEHMSNGEDAADDDAASADDPDDSGEEITEESLNERLDAVAEALEAAETEADLDDVEADLDAVERDLEAAALPEPDDEEEDGPAAELEGRVDDLRSDLEAARGPYGADVVETVESAADTVGSAEWTADGREDAAAAVEDFAAVVAEALDADVAPEGGAVDDLAAALEDAADAVGDAALDADGDAETIATLLEAAETLEEDLEAAEVWDDLETNEQLRAQGFYGVLGHYKDYPVEWAALKEHEKQGNTGMILLALDSLQSEFMERHCLEALRHMGKRAKTEDAVEEVLGRAEKRDRPSIEILGKMAATEATETLVDYVDEDSNPQLQKTVFKALGEIGAEEAVGPLANKLDLDDADVRPYAARALGLIGDPRAVDPLADTLADDDSDEVRAAAAWALRQIGTEEALETVAAYADERAFTVQSEAEKADEALEAAAPSA